MPTEYVSDNLPLEAQDAGMDLLWHRDPGSRCESITLINSKHQPLFYWPYNASYGEVREKALELLREGRLDVVS